MKYNENFLKRVREQYPPGTCIRLTEMKDPCAARHGGQAMLWMLDQYPQLCKQCRYYQKQGRYTKRILEF